jgi:membrane peptidoglycan carboxypeptidase
VTGVWFGFDQPATIMSRGFAGTVAVPAWARFMKTATRGHSADWYEMPPEVEKVAMCRISGARATDACRYHYVYRNNVPVGTIGILPAGYPQPVPSLAEPAVYEDLFPVGTVPSELCPIHRSPDPEQNGEGHIGNVPGPADTALQPSTPQAPRKEDAHRHGGERHQEQQ